MKNVFLDKETCGFYGMPVLLQYAIDDGPIVLYNLWKEPIWKSIMLIEWLLQQRIIGFNLAFDGFHMAKFYTTIIQLDHDWVPEEHITEMALAEKTGRDGPCIKPADCVDLMCVARKGPYQSLMDRSDIRVKRIPTVLADKVAAELSERIALPNVYFARRKDPTIRWQVQDIHDENDELVPEFKDLVLKFAPSSGLKALATDIGIVKDATHFEEVGLPDWCDPVEEGYAPFALSPVWNDKNKRYYQPGPGCWYGTWPDKIKYHIEHWAYNEKAREYATDDIVMTRGLYHHFGQPASTHDDRLAWLVAVTRWKGFKIDEPQLQEQLKVAEAKKKTYKINFNAPKVCYVYLSQVMSEMEQSFLVDENNRPTTGKIILQEIATWKEAIVCSDCGGMGCDKCKDGLVESNVPHPAAKRAREILDFRSLGKEIDMYEKLLAAGRFHASFKVIGTLSGRMAGADGLNAQGIDHDEEVRVCFPLAFDDEELDGGDFDSFEVNIADAVYNDPVLHEDLTKQVPCCSDPKCSACGGKGSYVKKMHGIFGCFFFPGHTYEQLIATKSLPGEDNLYSRSKQGVFAIIYFGDYGTLMRRVGISEAAAVDGYNRALQRYVVFGKERQKYADLFCSMRQPGGIGTKVEWHEPADYVESMFGFRRYYTLENKICKVLYNLSNALPEEWAQIKTRVVRRDREQTAAGALRSALYAAAFAVQASNMRSAGNHVIQSPGSEINKRLQDRLWELQPSGVSEWVVRLMNVHDELMAARKRGLELKPIVDKFIEEFKQFVPLLKMDWHKGMSSWASK